MKYKLFLDDERIPTDYDFNGNNIFVVRDCESAVEIIEKLGVPEFIWFDHDLGPGQTGYDFAKWFVNYVHINGVAFPEDFDYIVISMNPVGRDNIKAIMRNIRK